MKNREIQFENKTKLKELESDYINSLIDKMPEYIEKRKEEIVNEMIQYAEKNNKPVKWDKDGNPISYEVKLKPVVISNYFLKPICNLSSCEPIYSPEKLSIVFDYYMYIISEINDKIGDFPPSLNSFCKLASLTSGTLRRYRASDDLNMRIIVEKIYDQIGEENITMSQIGVTKERSTLFKLRSQNEVTEAIRPNVNINITEKVDTNAIESNINKYKKFLAKKK